MRNSRTDDLGSKLHTRLWALLLLPLLPGAAWAGAQGTGLPAVAPPTDTELHRFLMNDPGAPVPRYVCVDAPTRECLELTQTPPYTNNGVPTVLSSPECPAGPAAQACRPDSVGSVAGRVDVSFLPQDQWSYTDVSSSYPPPSCASGDHATTIDSPATYATAAGSGFGDPVYVDTPLWVLDSFVVTIGLGCAEWVRTDSTDDANTGPQLALTLGRTAHVYVAYDADATTVPQWLSNNTVPTGAEFDVKRTIGLGTRRYAVWKTPDLVPKGTTIEFGGNADDGADGAFMYLVMVRPVNAVEACGSLEATIGIEASGSSWDPVQTVSDSGCGVIDLNGDFLEEPIPLPGGLGWWAGDPLTTACDEFFFGFEIQAERTLLVPGLLYRKGFVDAAQAQDPALCNANPYGQCQPLGMTTVDALGNMTGLTPLGADPFDCTFEVTFTPPGQTRIVERYKFPNPVIDDAGSTTLLSETPTGAGIIDDVDVFVQTSAVHADNLQARFGDGAQTVVLHDRPGCDTSSAQLDLWWDSDSPLPASTWTGTCGSLFSSAQPIETLDVFDGGLAEAPFELEFRDLDHPGDGTVLEEWGLRITTNHTECSDDIDNDFDGNVDFDGGPDGGLPDANCFSFADDRERRNRSCGLGAELAVIAGALVWVRRRRAAAG